MAGRPPPPPTSRNTHLLGNTVTFTNVHTSRADALLDHPWPRQWRGHWVGANQSAPDARTVLGGVPVRTEYSRHLFRRSFQLKAVPDSAPVRLTADSRYTLFVNGAEVGDGPVRANPRRLHYDAYDIAAYLQRGTNTIVVLVTYYGAPTSFWTPAVGTAGFGRSAVLVMDAEINGQDVSTDGRWEHQGARAWSDTPRQGMEGLPPEVLDARALAASWREGMGGEWEAVYLQPVAHLSGLARTSPPTDPFGPLLPRPVRALSGERVVPQRTTVSTVRAAVRALAPSPLEHIRSIWPAAWGTPHHADPDGVEIEVSVSEARAILLDFGRIVVGRLTFQLEAPAGTCVDMMFLEDASPASSDEDEAGTGARYIARGHDDSFQAIDISGLRYVRLVITASTSAFVAMRSIALDEQYMVRTGSASFVSDDLELNDLYDAGVRTVELSTLDAFIDTPTREQRAWVGDGVVHQMVTLTTSEDWRPAARYIALGNSPRADGILPMSVGGDGETGPSYTIPDWSLYWVHGVYTLFRYTGDRQALDAAAPTVKRVLAWFAQFADEEGVLSDVPEWKLVDWSSIFLSGRSSILTALWALALREFAEISDYLGNAGDARWARALYSTAATGFEVFWDGERGTYVDHILDGERQDAASQIAGAVAIVSGLAPIARHNRVIAWMSDENRQVVRSWIGGDGGYDPVKIAEQGRGIQRVDWDAAAQTVVAEPFAAFLVHDAYALAGRVDLIRSSIRRWSSFLHDGYDTFGECWGWGTPVHGWSATPTRDIVLRIAGVTPGAPGFLDARIAPAFGVTQHFTAAVPTPFGPISIEMRRGTRIRLESPVPFEYVNARGVSERHPLGRYESDSEGCDLRQV